MIIKLVSLGQSSNSSNRLSEEHIIHANTRTQSSFVFLSFDLIFFLLPLSNYPAGWIAAREPRPGMDNPRKFLLNYLFDGEILRIEQSMSRNGEGYHLS